jgi:hypothetical protein
MNKMLIEKSYLEQMNDINPSKGGNSKVYKIQIGNELFAIKKYRSGSEAPAKIEHEFVSTYKMHGLLPKNFVKPIFSNQELLINCFEWVDGSQPIINSGFIKQSIDSLTEIHTLSLSNSKKISFNAIDSIFSISEALDQVQSRINFLSSRSREIDKIIPLFDLKQQFENLNQSIINNYFEKITFSLSDFGNHNILQNEQQNIFKFIDLEYFGLDSVNKFLVDCILHPKNKWPLGIKKQFVESLFQLYNICYDEIADLIKILSLKWICIILKSHLSKINGMSSESLTYYRELISLYLNISKSNLELSQLLERVSSHESIS